MVTLLRATALFVVLTTAAAFALERGPRNAPELKPAFPAQTRAPEAKSKTHFNVTEVAKGFRKPWSVAFLPGGNFLVTEKHSGNLFIVSPDGTKSAPVAGLPKVDGRGQGGLLDVEVAPDFEKSGLIYWAYYEPREGGNGLAVARGKLVRGEKPGIENLQVIFRMQPTMESTMHAGGRIVFAPDGKLFVTLGDRSILQGRALAQDLGSHIGGLVRINPDGSTPKDNPFVNRKGARPELWSYGHRNILAAALDGKNRLWVAEMGPRGGDELNLIKKGKNYGWPVIGYGEEYSGESIHKTALKPGMEQPVYFWDPVISPSGMTVYSGKLFPQWQGNVFIGALSGQALVRLVLKDDRVVGEEHLLTDRNERIRDVAQGPDGALYLLTDELDGKLLKVTPR